MSLDELRRLQLARLQLVLRQAYENVGHYRRAFDAAGLHPGDCRDLAGLAKFPLTSKADLRENMPYGMLGVPLRQVRRLHASSGTTGRPTVVGYTADDLDTWASVVARSIRAAGGRSGDVIHNAYGYGLFTGGLGVHYGGEKLGCTVIPASSGVTARQVQLITELRPRIITMTPSYMLTVIDELAKQGLDPRATSLEIGIFGAEPWTEQMRAEIEERTGIQAVDIYGLSEVIGPGVAQECVETKDGLTIWEDHFYPEVIDPVTGEVLPDGSDGELVFTSLTRQASPLIRYRTRDLTRLLPGTARPAMRRMAKVTGRSDDMIIVRGVNLFPMQVEEIVLRTPGLSPHFALELSTRGRMDRLAVRAEARPDFPAQRWPEAAAGLAGAILEALGLAVEADVVAPQTLPRSQGKLQRVRDLRSRA
ncbi:MAG TPA: phenylacetate--CoA ligase PaaK [Trebonia sp.]|jgi:phenylacetate-CoA ligase|nr:phenylacetate--CoA ligase PaaK [Trebonia sp.]